VAKAVDVKVTTARLTARLNSVKSGANEAAARGVYMGMQGAFRQSQREVPVKTGVLKNSGKLNEPVILGPTKAEVSITYGGAATKYAQKQHDDVTLNHPGGGKAHFIIDPVRDAVPAIKARMKQQLALLGK
jgi:hypothetical protein